jgi:hypothetical protein
MVIPPIPELHIERFVFFFSRPGSPKSARQVPKKNPHNSLCVKDMNACVSLAACLYLGVDLKRAEHPPEKMVAA